MEPVLKGKTKIPVTVITGFLGAGKTTLINNLLKKYEGIQFALVENEFGEVPIDTKLIKGIDASQMFELKQGCICCTISDEYELVLQELAERFPDLEHLLIETTGVADPAGVIQPFFRDENLKELYEFEGTICLVDAINFNHSPEKEITLKQLSVADLVLVNKSEKLDNATREYLQKEVKSLTPFARTVFTKFANAEDIELTSLMKKTRSVFDFMSYNSSHSHIQTRTFSFEEPLQKEEFLRRLEYALDIHKRDIYRAKGMLYFENDPFEYFLQGVGGSFELVEGDFSDGNSNSGIVLIGKGLNEVVF